MTTVAEEGHTMLVNRFEKKLIERIREKKSRMFYGILQLNFEAGDVCRLNDNESLTVTDFLYR